MNPRIISAYEVVSIIDYKSFAANASSKIYLNYIKTVPSWGQGNSPFAWLFDNLAWEDGNGYCTRFGCNYTNTTTSAAYWTCTTYGNESEGSLVWRVSREGDLGYYSGASIWNYGVRPVIEVSKTIFE